MIITWYGHACFQIQSGVRIVTDPYTPDVAKLRPVPDPADVVIMSSSDDPFHSAASAIPGQPLILDALEIARSGGSQTAADIRFDAIEVQESLVHKASPDPNAMYAFSVDGLRVAHMGDVGNPLNDQQIDFLRGTDILLALTGGPVTIELDDLDAVLAAVRPRIVIPMHYRIPNLRLNILGLEAFTERYPAEIVAVRPETALAVTPDRLPDSMRIVALQPVANQPDYPTPGAAPWRI
jgi:L-ascorbate metabolism protein UlaG (beta-lactamase superfamily)